MKIKRQNGGYTLWLSANDTYWWATGQGPNGKTWPCSTCQGKRLVVCVDDNGLWNLFVNGRDQYPQEDEISGDELDAIVADHLPSDLRHLWPVWGAPNA